MNFDVRKQGSDFEFTLEESNEFFAIQDLRMGFPNGWIDGEKDRKRNKVIGKRDANGVAAEISSSPVFVRCGRFDGLNRLPEELIFEVLARVERIKSLHQYKCVSKAWQSIVEGPQFFEAYRTHHRGGLLVHVTEFGGNGKDPIPFRVKFFYATISSSSSSVDSQHPESEPEPFFLRSTVPVTYRHKSRTAVVNGLVCFYTAINSFFK